VDIADIVLQYPWPLQIALPACGHTMREQAAPAKLFEHLQMPVFLLQMPMFEHSVGKCAVLAMCALPTNATPVAHVRCEQSGD
jgi:hypothetical protein